MQERILQFNKVTGNEDCTLAIKFLQPVNWNVKKA
jgi:hypothetical protein